MVFPSFSGRLASSIAAKAAAPEEITDKNPFTLADELSGCKCIFVGNGDNLIVDFRVQHIGDKACADALNLMRSSNAGREHCGSSRLNSNDLNRRVLGFQIFTDTGYRTAGIIERLLFGVCLIFLWKTQKSRRKTRLRRH